MAKCYYNARVRQGQCAHAHETRTRAQSPFRHARDYTTEQTYELAHSRETL